MPPAVPPLPPVVPLKEDGWSPFSGRTTDAPTHTAPAPGPTASPSPGSTAGPAPVPASGPVPAPAPRRNGSTWFGGTPVPPGPAEPARHRAPEDHERGEAPVTETDSASGLPKRRPRKNLVAERPGAPDAVAPVRRDPQATRGFLANYQTGIRQGVQESGENRAGQENNG
jgi:hypothetical protein